jgi:hypothetical protein
MRDSGRLRFEKGGVLAPIETRIGFVRQKSNDFGVVLKTENFRVFLLWETDSHFSSGVDQVTRSKKLELENALMIRKYDILDVRGRHSWDHN